MRSPGTRLRPATQRATTCWRVISRGEDGAPAVPGRPTRRAISKAQGGLAHRALPPGVSGCVQHERGCVKTCSPDSRRTTVRAWLPGVLDCGPARARLCENSLTGSRRTTVGAWLPGVWTVVQHERGCVKTRSPDPGGPQSVPGCQVGSSCGPARARLCESTLFYPLRATTVRAGPSRCAGTVVQHERGCRKLASTDSARTTVRAWRPGVL